jgi:hypothetical protein
MELLRNSECKYIAPRVIVYYNRNFITFYCCRQCTAVNVGYVCEEMDTADGGCRGRNGSNPDEIIAEVAPDHAVAGWRCMLCTSVCLAISGIRRHAKLHGYAFRVAGG